MNKVVEGRKRGIQWRMMERLDLDFGDDTCLLVQRWSDTKTKLKKLNKEPGKVRFKINEFKTKEMRVKPSINLVLTTNGRDVEQVKSFT
jgi:predicted nucleotidyltransferase